MPASTEPADFWWGLDEIYEKVLENGLGREEQRGPVPGNQYALTKFLTSAVTRNNSEWVGEAESALGLPRQARA